MFSRREFIAGVIAVSPGPIAHAAGQPAPNIEAKLNDYFAPSVTARDFSGLVLIERRGDRILQTWGRADFRTGAPHTVHTRYAAESISKMFTHAAVLALQAAGKLQMSDPLTRFIPTFPRADQITIRQLVDHKAGISRDLALTGKDATRRRTTSEVVELVAKTDNEPPGKDVSYSNNGYRILARVIEIAGKATFDHLIEELVLRPAGMHDTIFGGSPDQPMARRAIGYIPGPGWGTIRRAPPWDFSNSRGAASYYTSASDLMLFLRHVPLEPTDVEDAPGAVGAAGFRKKAGHDGFGNGFANLAYTYPGEGTRLVLLGNIQSGLFMSLQKDLRAILSGGSAKPPALPQQSVVGPSARWRDFVGSYELKPGAPLIIRRSRDHLEVSAGEDFHPLIAIGRSQFFMRLRYATLTFPPPDGAVKALQWEEGGGSFALKKLS